MTYAVVLQVKIDPDVDAPRRTSMLEHPVVPDVTELPGFQLASWLNDGNGTGVCLFEFEAEEHARAAVEALTPPGGPVAIGTGVFAIELEAAG
jgi:hypothetical protein